MVWHWLQFSTLCMSLIWTTCSLLSVHLGSPSEMVNFLHAWSKKWVGSINRGLSLPNHMIVTVLHKQGSPCSHGGHWVITYSQSSKWEICRPPCSNSPSICRFCCLTLLLLAKVRIMVVLSLISGTRHYLPSFILLKSAKRAFLMWKELPSHWILHILCPVSNN